MLHIFVSVLQCIQFWMNSFNIRHKWSLAWESCVIIFDLGIWLHCHLAMTLQQKHIVLRPFYNICSSEWIIFICNTNDHQHEVCWAQRLWHWPITLRSFIHTVSWQQILWKYCSPCSVQPITSSVLDGLFSYLAQTITRMKGCFACNDVLRCGGICRM